MSNIFHLFRIVCNAFMRNPFQDDIPLPSLSSNDLSKYDLWNWLSLSFSRNEFPKWFPPTLPGSFHRFELSSATSELIFSSQRSVSTTVCPSSISSTKRRISGSCHTPSISCPSPMNDSNHASLRQRQHSAAAKHLLPLPLNTSCANDLPVRICLTKRCFRWVSSSLRNKYVLCLRKLKCLLNLSESLVSTSTYLESSKAT